MIKMTLLGAVVGMALLVGAKAEAKVGDATWAACVWQTDSEAADAWLKLPLPKWQDKFETQSENLGLRLIATCDSTAADPAKPNRYPNWKLMRQQLSKSRPKSIPLGQQSSVEAQLCEYYAVKDGKRALYLAEAVRVQGEEKTTVYQIYFGQTGSGAVRIVDYAGRPVTFQFSGMPDSGAELRMPQVTIIASPSEGYTSEKKCRTILPNGNLHQCLN